MKPAQRIKAALAAMLPLLLLMPILAACEAEQDDASSSDCHHVSGMQGFRECDVTLRDGRAVTCLRIIDEGISCDWDRTSHE